MLLDSCTQKSRFLPHQLIGKMYLQSSLTVAASVGNSWAYSRSQALLGQAMNKAMFRYKRKSLLLLSVIHEIFNNILFYIEENILLYGFTINNVNKVYYRILY